MDKEKTYTLFWLTGTKEVVTGKSISEAVNKHYGGGVLRALDFWKEGDYMDSDEIIFDKEKHMWKTNLFSKDK